MAPHVTHGPENEIANGDEFTRNILQSVVKTEVLLAKSRDDRMVDQSLGKPGARFSIRCGLKSTRCSSRVSCAGGQLVGAGSVVGCVHYNSAGNDRDLRNGDPAHPRGTARLHGPAADGRIRDSGPEARERRTPHGYTKTNAGSKCY